MNKKKKTEGMVLNTLAEQKAGVEENRENHASKIMHSYKEKKKIPDSALL